MKPSTTSQKNPFLSLRVRRLFYWWFFFTFLLGILLGLVGPQDIGDLQNSATTLILVNIFIYGLGAIWIHRQFSQLRIRGQQIIGTLPGNYRWLPTLGLVLLLMLLSIGSVQVSSYLIWLSEPELVESILKEQLALTPEATSIPLFYKLLAATFDTFIAPAVEELLFRGVIIHRWAAKWSIERSLLLSSLVFGLLHPHNIVGMFVFGLVMAVLYIKTHTLIVPILCHALNNAIAVIPGLGVTNFAHETVSSPEQFRPDFQTGLLCIALSAPWLIWFLYKNWPSHRNCLPYFVNASK